MTIAGSQPRISPDSALTRLLDANIGTARTGFALTTLSIDPALAGGGATASRAQIAMALNCALFVDLLDRVPSAARYVADVGKTGEPIVFDHGALRTIDGQTGELPRGHAAFARILAPLGYEVRGLYPLPRLKMIGRAFVQHDLPETIPQFFVSELHVSELTPDAQDAVTRIFGNSTDPLSNADRLALDTLARDGAIPVDRGAVLLGSLLRCFSCQHEAPLLGDYETLLRHSPEGAWIATEGNAFNHATTRVPDVARLAAELKTGGASMKPSVEISQNGRVRQTAFIADKVLRRFRMPDGSQVMRDVPGSFYEFISRDIDPETGTLDLSFDSGNATGIFAVTREQ